MKIRKLQSQFFLTLSLSLVLPSLAAGCKAEDSETALQLSSASSVVMDLDTGALLYSEDSTDAREIGSLKNFMTVLLLAENCNLNTTVSFSEILYTAPDGQPRLGLQPGEEITLYDAACAILLDSAEDVAVGVAEYISGSPAAFTARMNERAQELGCEHTQFSDPGDPDSAQSYTCASDFALIAQAAYQNEAFREICQLTDHDIPSTNLTDSSRQLANEHPMLQRDSGYFQDSCTGGKETSSPDGTDNLVTFSVSEDSHLVAILLGAPDTAAACEDTTKLLTYGFDQLSALEPDTKSDNGSSGDNAAQSGGSDENAASQTDASGNIVASADSSGNIAPQADASGNIVSQTDSSGNIAPQADASGNIASQTDSSGNIAPQADGSGNIQSQPGNPAETVLTPEAERASSEPLQADNNSDDTSETVTQDASWTNTARKLIDFLTEAPQTLAKYARSHFKEVFIAGCAFLLFLLILIILLLKRLITDSRIRRNRKEAERLRQERESQIEQLSLEELENELRRRKNEDVNSSSSNEDDRNDRNLR